jgi:hypothetical protein
LVSSIWPMQTKAQWHSHNALKHAKITSNCWRDSSNSVVQSFNHVQLNAISHGEIPHFLWTQFHHTAAMSISTLTEILVVHQRRV